MSVDGTNQSATFKDTQINGIYHTNETVSSVGKQGQIIIVNARIQPWFPKLGSGTVIIEYHLKD